MNKRLASLVAVLVAVFLVAPAESGWRASEYESYKKFGRRDPKWDDAVAEAIRLQELGWVIDEKEGSQTFGRGQDALACVYFQKALDLGCDDPLVHKLYADASAHVRATQRAKKLYAEAAELAKAELAKGSAVPGTDRREFTRMIARRSLWRLANMYGDEPETALSLHIQANDLGWPGQDTVEKLRKRIADLEKEKEIRRNLEAKIKADPENLDLMLKLVSSYRETGNTGRAIEWTDRAIKWSERAVEATPDDVELLELHRSNLSRLGQYPEARRIRAHIIEVVRRQGDYERVFKHLYMMSFSLTSSTVEDTSGAELAWLNQFQAEKVLAELFDIAADRTELKNLAQKYPERLKQMAQAWQNWAKRTNWRSKKGKKQ